MTKLVPLFVVLSLSACNGGPSAPPAACVRPLSSFTDCAPTYAQQKSAPPGADPRTCTNCEMCQLFTGRCQAYDVWQHSWAYGEVRVCVYDATGALVGAMRATDHDLEGCRALVGGVRPADGASCQADGPGLTCQGDAGRD